MKAANIANGKAATTTNAERTSPKNKNKMMATNIEPSIKARIAVSIALLTKSVRSYTVLMVAPSGNACLAVVSFALTASTTLLAFSPTRDSAMPSTTSLPSRVTAPVRNAPPC